MAGVIRKKPLVLLCVGLSLWVIAALIGSRFVVVVTSEKRIAGKLAGIRCAIETYYRDFRRLPGSIDELGVRPSLTLDDLGHRITYSVESIGPFVVLGGRARAPGGAEKEVVARFRVDGNASTQGSPRAQSEP